MNSQQLKDYFKNLADNHPKIHVFQTWEMRDLLNKATKGVKPGEVAFFLDDPEFFTDNNGADQGFRNAMLAFMILLKADPQSVTQRDQVHLTAEEIAEDYLRRIDHDSRQYGAAGFVNFGWSSNTFRVGPIFHGLYGVRVEVDIKSPFQMQIDRSKWSDL